LKYPRVANTSLVREYVEQNLSKDLDLKISNMLKILMEYQEKARRLDPTKAKLSRRLLLGLREVRRSVKTKKARAIVVAINIEDSKTKGGLNDRISEIINLAKENETPIMYSMTTRRLGKSLGKPKTACVSVLSGDGAHAELKETISMTERLTTSWKNGVRTDVKVENEAEEVEREKKNRKETIKEKDEKEKQDKKKYGKEEKQEGNKKEKDTKKSKKKKKKKSASKKKNNAAGKSDIMPKNIGMTFSLNPSAGEFKPSWA